MSVKDFAASRGFVQAAPVVRTNVNKYPYVTFIDSNNKAENIYFSINAAKGVTAGSPVDKQLLSTHMIGLTTNAAGEQRVKLISNSERIELADLF